MCARARVRVHVRVRVRVRVLTRASAESRQHRDGRRSQVCMHSHCGGKEFTAEAPYKDKTEGSSDQIEIREGGGGGPGKQEKQTQIKTVQIGRKDSTFKLQP